MQYKGKLYGHLGGKIYFDTGKTADDWDSLEKRVAELKAENQVLRQPPVMRWVSISERLPEMEVYVLLFDNWKNSDGENRQDMKVGYLSEFTTRKSADGIINSCEWRGHEFLFNITHWMPLPEPPII